MTLRSDIVALIPLDNVWADGAPDNTDWPYAVVRADIVQTTAMRGDLKAVAITRLTQVDVWQTVKDEDESVLNSVIDALDGVKLDSGTHLSVQSAPRVPDPDNTVVHHAITVSCAKLR